MPATGEKILIFGASRGLGSAFYKEFSKQLPDAQFLLASRKKPQLIRSEDEYLQFDANQPTSWNLLFEKLNERKPTRFFYFPGGGPYGFFKDKEMKDHLWSLKVNLEFPMHLLHYCLQKDFFKQGVYVGSAIAEKPDFKAASYAAGKAGLKNFLGTVAQETDKDIRLFSPGYMDTDLIPLGSQVRKGSQKILNPDTVAKDLVSWVQKPHDGSFSLIYT